MAAQKAKERLVQIQTTHNSLVQSSTRQLKSRFITITNECVSQISQCPIKYVDYFVKVWFRAFVGMKDECMVLINGLLIRPYHLKEHEKYLHSRGHEDSYYKGTQLSACSVDGIDVEYRVFTESYGHKLGIDAIADHNETMSSSLHDLAHSMDEHTANIKSALTKRGVKNLKIHIRHKEESISGSIPKESSEGAAPIIISYARDAFKNCQRSVCLSTIVEMPPGMMVKQASTANNLLPSATTTSSIPAAVKEGVSRSRLAIYDSDDEKERQESLAAAELKQQQKLLEEQRKALNFGMDISLDDIKKSLGASSELLAVAPKNIDEDDDDVVIMEVNNSDNVADSSQRIEFRSVPVVPEDVCPPISKVLNVLVLSPVNPEISNENIPLSIDLTSGRSLVTGRTPSDLEDYVSVSEILDEACKRLWFSGLIEAQSNDDLSKLSHMRFPTELIIEKKPYCRGCIVKLPILEGKRHRIVCESNNRVSLFLAHLHKWMISQITHKTLHNLRNFEQSDVIEQICSMVWDHYALICRICSQLALGQFDFRPFLQQPFVGEVSEMLTTLLEGIKQCLDENVSIDINIGQCYPLASHLSTFLEYCNVINAAGCGITVEDTKKIVLDWSSKPVESWVLPIVHLDLSSNKSILPCNDYEWLTVSDEDNQSWLEFCALLLTHSPRLKSLNVSHVVRSDSQATILIQGLQNALIRRHQLGLPPLDKLLLGGLQREYPTIVNEFKTALHDSNSGVLQGVVSIDGSGVSRSL